MHKRGEFTGEILFQVRVVMIASAVAGMGTSLLSIVCQATTDNAVLNGRIYFGEDEIHAIRNISEMERKNNYDFDRATFRSLRVASVELIVRFALYRYCLRVDHHLHLLLPVPRHL